MLINQAPFQTFAIEHPDFNSVDTEAEFQRLFQRQKAIAGLLDGQIPADELLDLLEDQGLDPAQYVDCVVDNVEFVLSL